MNLNIIFLLGPVVRKSVSPNPAGLQVKNGFDFSCIKAYIRANVLWGFTLVKGKTEGNKIYSKTVCTAIRLNQEFTLTLG